MFTIYNYLWLCFSQILKLWLLVSFFFIAVVELKFGGAGEDRREKFLGELATAHDMFMEITKNLDEGAKFYADITKLLVNLQSKVNDYCFARRAEKDELIKELVGDTIRVGISENNNYLI